MKLYLVNQGFPYDYGFKVVGVFSTLAKAKSGAVNWSKKRNQIEDTMWMEFTSRATGETSWRKEFHYKGCKTDSCYIEIQEVVLDDP